MTATADRPVGGPAADERISVVVVTRDRRAELLATLERLVALPEQPRVIVVDNGSTDGTAEAARGWHPRVEVVCAGRNLGGAGRNLGVALASTPYVAFSDDDSWWAPGALRKAAGVMDRHPRLGLLGARVLVGPQEALDPVCAEMAASPLPVEHDLPGPPVLGFLACGAVVRRRAFLALGGFQHRFGIGGEESLLALDMADAGWGLAYVDGVVAHHHPSSRRQPASRRRRQCRNALWTAWLRRSPVEAVAATVRMVGHRYADLATWAGLADAVADLPTVVRDRRVVAPSLRRQARLLERGAVGAGRRGGEQASAS